LNGHDNANSKPALAKAIQTMDGAATMAMMIKTTEQHQGTSHRELVDEVLLSFVSLKACTKSQGQGQVLSC